MDTVPQANPYAPPTSHVADVHRPEDGQQLANLWVRLGAALLDFVIAFALMWIVSKVTPWKPFDASPDMSITTRLLHSLGGFTLFMVINGWLLLDRGQTVGKMITKIRITSLDGGKVPPLRMLVRYSVGYLFGVQPILQMVYSLADCLMVFRASRRTLHDLFAGTIVVKA